MGNLSPVAIAIVIVLAVAALGGVITWLRRTATFRSYEDLRGAAQTIAKALKGEIHRDGEDLVVAGNQGSWPVVVRFSYAENTPGLDLRMEAPAGFTLWIASRSAERVEGRALMRTSDSRFDARFSTRSDHPIQANMLLMSKQAVGVLQRLCCSGSTSLAITKGAIELAELVTPRPYTAEHVLDHLAGMASIADFLKDMPGAEQFKIAPIRRERQLAGRIAIAAGVIVAVATVVTATRSYHRNKVEVPLPPQTSGLLPVEAERIPGAADWRLATADDFDPGAAAWLRGFGLQASGRVTGDFSGKGDERDAAYTLLGPDGSRRLVLLAGGLDRYDVKFPYVGLIARLPKSAVASTQWVGKPPQDPDGDGLLVIRKRDDPASGLVLFLSGARIISGVPVNYQSLQLLD